MLTYFSQNMPQTIQFFFKKIKTHPCGSVHVYGPGVENLHLHLLVSVLQGAVAILETKIIIFYNFKGNAVLTNKITIRSLFSFSSLSLSDCSFSSRSAASVAVECSSARSAVISFNCEKKFKFLLNLNTKVGN